MEDDNLDSAERRWRSRPLFRRERRSHGWTALLLLVLLGGSVWVLLNTGLVPSATALLQLLPPVQ